MAWRHYVSRQSDTPEDGISTSDVIYPLHAMDHSAVTETIMTWTMRFNDVLDPEMLHSSLAQVLETGDWRKLGGRFRKQGSRYQLHVPPVFTKARPALTFSHERLDDIAIEEHPLGCKLPRATSHPSIQSDPEQLAPFSLPADAPTTFAEYLSKGHPPLGLHVVTFANATLVTVAWPHVIMDAGGLLGLVRAWNASLRGRISEIPTLMGTKDDVFEEYADPARHGSGEMSLMEKKSMPMLHAALFWLRALWDVIFGPKMVMRLLFLPKSSVERLQRQVKEELGSLDVGDETMGAQGEVRARISKGDVLVAWIVKIIASAIPSPRPITALSTVDLRLRLPGLRELDKASSVHVQNLTLPAILPLSAAEAASPSIGQIALANRRALMEQVTSNQLIASLQLLNRIKNLGLGGLKFMGSPNSLLVTFTNWTRDGFCRLVDFSPAVIRPGDASSARKNPPGTILCHYPQMIKRPHMLRNLIFILGTDHEDNYWLSLLCDSQMLSKVEESIRTLSKK